MKDEYDVVVVGARCAGAIAAGRLAAEGWDVLLVDKATFPSDTVSTHAMFPNTLARFAELGILDRLEDRYTLPYLHFSWRILGHGVAGSFTPVGGHELATSIRRITLDNELVGWAIERGAEARFGTRVVGLLGSGTEGDPVRGVRLEGGADVRARWVIGADGRASTLANLLDLEKENPLAGEMSFLFAYWRGLPRAENILLEVNEERMGIMRNPCEDGIDLVSVAGPPEMTRGSSSDREREYARRRMAFPETIDPNSFDAAERISDLVVVPETMMRGFFRRANGPGWALIGDAGHFKHPGTAQGISDAIEQALFVTDALVGSDPHLDTFEAWRRDRSRGYYSWSFLYGSWPVPDAVHPYMAGLSSDSQARQDWLDTFTRVKKPSDVNTSERMARWFGPN